MRRSVQVSMLGVVVCLGCVSPGGPAASLRSASEVNDPGSVLTIAFEDLSVEKRPEAPIRLTASDGSGLALVELSARAVVDDPLAFTELHLVFENPEDRVREGTFSIVLPQGASISRFAMRTPAGLTEGEVVERQKARVAYEDFLHRRQDPALLEQSAGNEFSARVFPIGPREKKELVVSYSQEITTVTPYVLPLRGLPEIGSLEVEVYLAGRAAPAQALSKKKVIPDADLRLDASVFPRRGGLRSGNLVVTRVRPVVASRPEPLTSALILIDTSASRALGLAEGHRAASRVTRAIAAAAGEDGRVVVAAYDQTIEPIYEGPAAGYGDEAARRLRQRLALGASNLDAALAWAGEQAGAKKLRRVVLITDGIPTAGATDGDRLRARVLAWKDAGVERLDAIGAGGIRDDDLLRSLANAGLPNGGVVIDAGAGEAEMARRLSEATTSGVLVKVAGADFVFPDRLDGVQAGDEALVYANVPENEAVRLSVGRGEWESPDLARVARPLLERAWVGAKLESLLERERREGPSDALTREIVGLSTRHRVLTPKSALLVLETDWDYRRFGIDRTALADILVADGGNVSLLRRSAPARPKPAPTAWPPPRNGGPLGDDPLSARGNLWGDEIGDSFGAGGLGLTGVGEGGGGHGEGVGLGGVGTIGRGAGTAGGQATSAASPGARGAAAPRPTGQGASPPTPTSDARPAVTNGRVAARPPTRRWTPDDLRAALVDTPSPEVDREREAGTDQASLADPYSGTFKTVMGMVASGRAVDAVKTAFAWRRKDPGDVLALVALGEGFEAAGELGQAARCYGSLVDLFPSRADMRRFAGERLERLALREARDLALDTYEKAALERPDHPSSHRLYAYALLRRGRHEEAFEAVLQGLWHDYPSDRFAGVRRILAEDLGLVAASWIAAEPARKDEIERRVRDEGGLIEDQPSLRFVLNWETDANDVDFHIRDAKGNHAFYGRRRLETGGLLYADVTTGYGPECFTIRKSAAERSGPYTLHANYYSRGPMGYGMGKLEIIEHDGKGGLKFEERPFVVMNDKASVDLGTVR